MFTERPWRQHPAVIKAVRGLPAVVFWELIAQLPAPLPAYAAQGLERATRQRGVGGGRDFEQPLGSRVAVVVTY